jgi:hypothetical protein
MGLKGLSSSFLHPTTSPRISQGICPSQSVGEKNNPTPGVLLVLWHRGAARVGHPDQRRRVPRPGRAVPGFVQHRRLGLQRTYTSEVTNVTHATYTYDPGANVITSQTLNVP